MAHLADTIGSSLPYPVRKRNRFENPGYHVNRGLLDILRWKRTSRPAEWPKHVPITPTSLGPRPPTGIAVTAVGHATFVLQTHTLTFVTDPHWGERAGPFGRFGPRRVQAPGVRLDSIRELDVVLLSHDHYDHCDLPTLRTLSAKFPRARLLAPLGSESLAKRAGFPSSRFSALNWWQSADIADQHVVTATPARHWCNRVSGSRNERLWCGFHLSTADTTVVFTGDTAYDSTMFSAVGRHLRRADLAMIPIGAYEPRWFMREQHCNPAEAIQIHRDLGAVKSIGMHWGTFQLTDEPRDEPVRHLAAARAAAGLAEDVFTPLIPGERILVRPDRITRA